MSFLGLLIARYLPGLGGVLGAFLNPWVWLVVLAASSSSFLYATHLGNQRLEAYEDAQEAIEKGRKAVIRYVVVQQKVIDKETVDELKAKNAQLTRDNAALFSSLSKHIQAGIRIHDPIPSVAGGSEEGDPVRDSRTKLVEGLRIGLQRFVDEYRPSIERGDRIRNLLEACYDFTEKQHTLTGGMQQ